MRGGVEFFTDADRKNSKSHNKKTGRSPADTESSGWPVHRLLSERDIAERLASKYQYRSKVLPALATRRRMSRSCGSTDKARSPEPVRLRAVAGLLFQCCQATERPDRARVHFNRLLKNLTCLIKQSTIEALFGMSYQVNFHLVSREIVGRVLRECCLE